jgi:hypothetical protein
VLSGAWLLAKRLDAFDDEPAFRAEPEVLRQFRLDGAIEVARRLQIALPALVRVGEQEPAIVAHRSEELLQRAIETHLALQRFHLRMDALDLGEPKRVDLVRGHRGRRVGREPLCVERGAVGQLPDASRDGVAVSTVLLHPCDQRLVRRTKTPRQRVRCSRPKLPGARRVDRALRGERRDLRVRVRVDG